MIVTLTTDFGYSDPFVGMMKGVLSMRAPMASVIDITHGLERHSITGASLAISTSYRYFPEGTVHVVVVDPGVGSAREPIVVVAEGHFFVGPNNGVFTGVIKAKGGMVDVYHITAEEYFIKSPGNTFHGRDLFCPVAAELVNGRKPEELGPKIEKYMLLPFSTPEFADGELSGEVIHIDTFGNAFTNISAADVVKLTETTGARSLIVEFDEHRAQVVRYYAEGSSAVVGDENAAPHALMNSTGLLEIFIYKGNAARACNISIGQSIKIRPS